MQQTHMQQTHHLIRSQLPSMPHAILSVTDLWAMALAGAGALWFGFSVGIAAPPEGMTPIGRDDVHPVKREALIHV